MNWYVHGTTNLRVGFERDGDDCEGGHCEHLKDGDQAFGYSGEADTWGREIYLDCEACYKQFLESRKTEPMDCHDCGMEVPRNEGVMYTPYDIESTHAERMNRQFFVCNTCREMETHQRRLKLDEERREDDRQLLDDQSDEFLDNSLIDDDPLDDDDIDDYPEESPFHDAEEEDPNEVPEEDDGEDPLDFPFYDEDPEGNLKAQEALLARYPPAFERIFRLTVAQELLYDADLVWGMPRTFSPTVRRVEVRIKPQAHMAVLQRMITDFNNTDTTAVNEVVLDNKWVTK